jgi:uncharacterized membrane protein YdbT with pleckstrin-like domain
MYSPRPPDVANQEEETTLFEGRPALLPSLGAVLWAIVTLGVYALYRLWIIKGIEYKVTTRRIVVETGVLSKKMEQVDLYRIADYAVERPLGQRLMGTGNISLETLERAEKQLDLRDLKTDVVALYEAIRQATELDRKRRGVRLFE